MNSASELNVDCLLSALDNNKNESIMNLTTQKIQEMIFSILKELHLDRETMVNYFKKLKGYKYVDELNDLKYGGFIRWIPITDPTHLPLNQCGIICDIIISDDGVYIVCKNFMHRHYRFKMDECLIFQKLSAQELIILSALDHLIEEQKVDNNKLEDNEDSEDSEDNEDNEDSEDSEDNEDSEESEEEDEKYKKYKKNSKLNNKI
jgi:hypothetical protein